MLLESWWLALTAGGNVVKQAFAGAAGASDATANFDSRGCQEPLARLDRTATIGPGLHHHLITFPFFSEITVELRIPHLCEWLFCVFAGFVCLWQRGAHIEQDDAEKSSPLLVACQNGQMTSTLFLLGHGANINSVDKDHCTCLHWAAYTGT